MQNFYSLGKVCLFLTVLFFSSRIYAISYTWNGSVSSDFGTAANWSPMGVPGAVDDIIITSAGQSPVFDELPGVRNFTINSGSFNINGFFFLIRGTANFNGGSVVNGTIQFQNAGNVVFGNCSISSILTGSASAYQFNGATFNQAVTITRTGSGTSTSNGGNTFNGNFHLTNNNGTIVMNNTTADIYNGTATFTSNSNQQINIAHTSGLTQFNNHVFINSLTTGTIQIGVNGGQSRIASGFSIQNGSSGINSGTVNIRNLTQQGNVANVIAASNSASVNIQNNCNFGGNVTLTTGNSTFTNSVFAGNLTVTKLSNAGNTWAGGNTINGNFTLNHNGSGGTIVMGSVNPDVIAGNAVFSINGNGIIDFAATSLNNSINGIITLTSSSTSASSGVRFGQSGGTLTLGNTVEIGASGFSNGVIRLRNITQTVNAPIDLIQTTGAAQLYFESGTVINGNVNVSFPRLFLNGSTFNSTAAFSKSGTGNDFSNGGNIFNSTVQFTNNSNSSIYLANTTADIFNSQVTFLDGVGSGIIFPAHTALNNQFNGNIIAGSTSAGGVRFGQNGGSSILSSGNTLLLHPSGMSAGELRIRNFQHMGSNNPIDLNMTFGSSVFRVEDNCVFNSTVRVQFPQIFVSGSVFNADAEFIKIGANENISNGGNVFNGIARFRTTSSNIILAQALPDVFNQDAYFTNQGNGLIGVARVSLNNQFNGDIYASSTSGNGVRFGEGNGSSVLAAGKSIFIGSEGFSAGSLIFRNFTQNGNATIQLSGTNTAQISFQPGCSFGGKLQVSFPSVFTTETTFNDEVLLVKTGNASANYSAGGNTFNASLTLRNTSSQALGFGNNLSDVFNGNLILENTSTGALELARTSQNNQINGNLIIQATGTGNVLFSNNNGSSRLAADRTITIQNSTCNAATLLLRNLTQLGTSAIAILNISGVNSILSLNNCLFNGVVNINTPRIALANTTFNQTVTLTKNGPSQDFCLGNNQFMASLRITNLSANSIVMSNSVRDIYNGLVSVDASGIGGIYLAHTGANNEFRENIAIGNFSASSVGLFFGQNGGSSLLFNGKTIAVSDGVFQGQSLRFRNFIQQGSTVQTLSNITGACVVAFETGTQFNANLNVTTPGITLNGATFNAQLNITKTGTSNNDCTGNNTFNGQVFIQNNSTGYLRLASVSGGNRDIFNSSVIIVNSVNNTIDISSRFNSEFRGNISNQSAGATCTFGVNGGTLNLTGTAIQTITSNASFPITFQRLAVNKTGGRVNLTNQIRIGISLTLTSGIVFSSSSSLLVFNNASSVSGANNLSYIDGPVRKIGNQSFIFPVGKSGNYRPISISAPSNNTHHFTAEYFLQSPGAIYNQNSREASIHHISQNEYWILNRTNGNSAVSVTLSWIDGISGQVTNLSKLRVCRWDGAMWRNHGNSVTNGNTSSGNVTSSGAISSFSPFTLGSIDDENPLPIELIHFAAISNDKTIDLLWSTASERNNHYFEIERSADLQNFETIGKIYGAGNSNTVLKYQFTDLHPYNGSNYYRLKQVDYDGTFSYSDIQVGFINTNTNQNSIDVYPNPAVESITINGEFNQFESGQIIISSLNGVIMLNTKFDKMLNLTTLNVSDLPSGIYIIQVKNGENTFVNRFLKF